MKKILLFTTLFLSLTQLTSQTLFSNSLGNLSLQNYTTASSSVQYTTLPSVFTAINDSRKNNIGSVSNPNKPFNVPALAGAGWAVVYNPIENDTFLVSTSWLDTIVTVDRWIISPPISNITANTVLTWLAKSPDANNKESYLVYGTNKIGTLTPQDFTVGDQLFNTSSENSVWTRRSVNLGNFIGQTLRFAFRDNSNDKFQLWIDDIEVITLANNIDAALTSIETPKYILTNSSQSISVNITNLSAAKINDATLNYQIGNSNIQTETITFTDGLGYKQSGTATFGYPLSITTAGNYKLKTWLSAINSNQDQNNLNDTSSIYITVQNTSAKKSVLVEQFVNAFDGECTDAQQRLLLLQNDSVVVVNIHDGDSLKETNSVSLLNTYKKSTATAVIDRTYFASQESVAVTRPLYSQLISNQLKKVSPANISVINKVYNASAKQLSFTIKADFIGDVKGDLRINAYLTENNVHGPSNDISANGYNQLNNLYNVPWSPFYQMGYFLSMYNSYLLNAYQFKHQNTLVHSFDGSFGNTGTIPTIGGTQGQSYQQTFTITVPTLTNSVNKYNFDNLFIVGFLAEYDTDKNKRNILNVVKQKITTNPETVGIKEIFEKNVLSIYPNPSNGTFYLNSTKSLNTYDIKVIDLTGRTVLLESLFEVGNTATLQLNQLNNGIYFLHISSESGNFVEKIVIQKN